MSWAHFADIGSAAPFGADGIKFVEEIQRSESDYKQLGEKYAKFFKNETAMRFNTFIA